MSYKTYQEAKIAMPLACIIHDTDNDIFFGMPSRVGTILTSDGCKFAEPQNYCMTVEKFLADGHKFVEGDLILGTSNNLVTVGLEYTIGIANMESMRDFERYILRAAELENQMNIDKVETQTEHQEEMSAFSGEAEWNGEGLPPVGVECEWRLEGADDSSFSMCKVLMITNHTVFMKSHRAMNGRKEFALPKDAIEFRKPETPQQREKRERLESAYDLYFEWMLDGNTSTEQIKTLEDFLDDKEEVNDWLRIVDKTNYRKGVR